MELNKKILLVEDSETDRFLLTRFLSGLHYEYDSFSNGQELLNRLHQYPSSLILLDIEMPLMNGIDVARLIKANHCRNGREFVLIGISGHSDPSVTAQMKSAGFTDYLPKPISRMMLDAKLQHHLSPGHISVNKPASLATDDPAIKSYSLQMFEGEEEEFRSSIISLFLKNTPASLDRIRQAIDDADYENIRFFAHKLKPHFIMFHINGTAALLQELELLAQTGGDMEKISELTEAISREGMKAVEQMRQEI